MKKQLIAIGLSAVLALGALAGCGNKAGSGDTSATTAAPAGSESAAGSSSGAAQTPAGGKLRIALVMSHLTNAFTTTFSESAKAEGEKQGVEVTVFDGKKDVANQISQIQSAVTQKYDAILVEPISVEGIKPAVEMANEAGIPIATCIQKMKEQELAKAYIGGDDMLAGKLEMEKAIEAIGGKGNIAVLYGPMGSDAQIIRKAGYDEALKNYPDVKIVFEQTANWVTDEALKITENWLASGQEISAVVSQNDSMGIGAAKAISDAGKTDAIKVFGVDATPDGLDAIQKGTMFGSVSQDTAGMGALSVQTIVKIAKGEKTDAEVLTTPVWVTKDNVAEFIK